MRSFRIGSAFGIPIRLDLTFLLVLPLFAYLIGLRIEETTELFNDHLDAGLPIESLAAGATPWVLGSVAAVGLFVGVLAHEFGHSLVAMRYDISIDSITLWIFGGLAQLTEMPEDWRTEFAIAIAGPIVSVLVGVACYALYLGATAVDVGLDPAIVGGIRYVLLYLAILNVALAGFNMIPAFPMDGGRILRAILGRTRTFARATQIAAEVGKFFAILLGLFGLLQFNIIMIGIAFFVYIAASGEAQQVTMKAAFEGVAVRDVMTPANRLHTVDSGTSVRELMARMLRERHTGYPVVENGEPVGIVTLDDAREVREIERDAYTVAEVMSRDLVTIGPDAEAMEALSRMREHGVGRLPVVDRHGRLVGLVSRTDLMTALDVIKSGGEVSPGPDDRRTAGPVRR